MRKQYKAPGKKFHIWATVKTIFSHWRVSPSYKSSPLFHSSVHIEADETECATASIVKKMAGRFDNDRIIDSFIQIAAS